MIVLVSTDYRPEAYSKTMPSLFRFLAILAVIAGLGYAAMFALATLVDLTPREITVTVPQDRFIKPR
jgi:hypothetical protein